MLTQKQNYEIFTITMKNIEKAFESKSYTDSQSFVSEEYHDLIDVFEKQHTDKLLSHQKEYDIEIELKSEKNSNFRFLYNMLQEKLQMLQQYFDEHLAKKFIQSSYFLFAFSVLFVKKLNRELYFCIDY